MNKSKGAIRFFAIALALVCLFQLSFTFIARGIENRAERVSGGNPARKRAYLDSLATRPVFNALIKKYSFQDVKERELNLGLDLRGGMYVTLEVAQDGLLRDLSNNNTDPAFVKALAQARKEAVSSQRPFIDNFYARLKENDPKAKLSTYFANPKTKEGNITFNSSDESILDYLRVEAKSALDVTYNILRARVDKFGVSQPNIQPNLEAGRIVIELPGVSDPERVRKLLKASAKLDFYETFTLDEVYQDYLIPADRIIYEKEEAEKGIAGTSSFGSDLNDTNKSNIPTPAPSNGLAALQGLNDTGKNTGSGLNALKGDSGATAGGDTGKGAAGVADSNRRQPLMQLLFAAYRPEDGNTPIIGRAFVSDTGKVNKMFADPDVADLLPPEIRLRWGAKAENTNLGDVLTLYGLKATGLEGEESALGGDGIIGAKNDFDQQSSNYVVSMQMNAQSASRWAQITGRNKGKYVAIVLDEQVYSAPVINDAITGGNSQISGNFTANESGDLANILKAGKLPVSLDIIEEAVIGPTLGAEAIQYGLLSFLIALGVILLFMAFYYSTAGWVANLVLVVNLFFVMGVLSSLGAALTLPGIAGIVLTIGLAVDANILIFERVREELALGKGTGLAIKEGYKHAMSSIIDSNVTLLLLGIILYAFGSGPVQGFAITLIIGIACSLFSAVLLSRLVFDWLLKKNRPIAFGTKLTANLFKNIHIDFVGNRKKFYILSTIIIALGLGFYFKNGGLNLGLDFKGGRTYVIRFDKPHNTDEVRSALEGPLQGLPEVKTYGGQNQLRITTGYRIGDGGDDVDKEVEQKLGQGLATLGDQYKIESYQKVGPAIAADIITDAYAAVFFSCLLMFLYIVVRFRQWQYGVGAVVALFHDVLIVLSFYTIFDGILPFALEIDQHFIAAILTVMGYTMTESVVVFDRIRETLNNNNKTNLFGLERAKLINYALNSTLSRTINTSLTVFFVLLMMFIFGGEVIRGFIFALLVGRIIGTYSSLCISTPIVVDLGKATNPGNTSVPNKPILANA